MKNPIEKILDENNNETIEITGTNGEKFYFEQVALIPIEDTFYTILHPLEKDVLPDDVLVFKLFKEDKEYSLILEENEDIINEIFDEYYALMKNKRK